jgi:hypothetical protein
MEKPKKTLSGPVTVISIVLLLSIAFRSFLRMIYWWDHSNPIFAIWQGTAAALGAFFALAFALSLFDKGTFGEAKLSSKDGFISRFCSQDSPFLPTAVGLLLSMTGAYGMLVLVNEENVVFDWTFFGALLGTGLYVLKRTFFVED